MVKSRISGLIYTSVQKLGRLYDNSIRDNAILVGVGVSSGQHLIHWTNEGTLSGSTSLNLFRFLAMRISKSFGSAMECFIKIALLPVG